MPSDRSTTVAIPAAWLAGLPLLGAILGCAASFAIGPAVTWLLGVVGDAPGPLRLAALLPLPWALPVLGLAGLILGSWVAREWWKENGTIEIGDAGVTVHRSGANTHVRRDLIAGIFLDRAELVIHGADTHEVLRLHTDRLLVSRFAAAFERFDLPWRGTTDPFESSFTTWVDKDPRLDAAAHEDLRTRARALADKRPGTAEHAREALRSRGISVRDRDGNQQYRMDTADDQA